MLNNGSSRVAIASIPYHEVKTYCRFGSDIPRHGWPVTSYARFLFYLEVSDLRYSSDQLD